MSREMLIEVGEKIKQHALKAGFEEVAVMTYCRESVMVKFANGEPSVVQNWTDRVAGVYLVKGQRILGTEIPIHNLDQVYKTIDSLLTMHEKIPPSMLYAPLPSPEKHEPLPGQVDQKLLKAIEDPSPVSEAIVESANRYKIDTFAGMVQLTYEQKCLVNSKDAQLVEDSTYLKVYLRSFAGDGSGQWSLGSRRLDMKKIEEVAETASRFAYESRRQEEYPPGKTNILLSPMVAGNFFNYIADMATASSIMMGFSIFMNKKPGEKVATEKLTLLDDPRNPELPGSTSFDDEGLRTYSKPIIEKGVLSNILHNTKTASKMGGKSTGNAGMIFPRVWNINIHPGDHSFEELLAEMKEGLVVTNNWYTRLQNYIEGTFSTILRDAILIVKNGEIVGAAKKLRIADSFPRILQNIVALGKETYDMYWWEVETPTRTPYILVKEVGTSKHTA
jgi:PmbA protein